VRRANFPVPGFPAPGFPLLDFPVLDFPVLAPGTGSRPATMSSNSAPTVSAAQARLAPIPPDEPRFAQPTT
jgi:hypothetical protein